MIKSFYDTHIENKATYNMFSPCQGISFYHLVTKLPCMEPLNLACLVPTYVDNFWSPVTFKIIYEWLWVLFNWFARVLNFALERHKTTVCVKAFLPFKMVLLCNTSSKVSFMQTASYLCSVGPVNGKIRTCSKFQSGA